MDLLWRDVDEHKANASFRQTVRHLRVVSDDIAPLDIETGSGKIAICPPPKWCLEDELEKALADPDRFSAATGTLQAYLSQLDLLLGLSDSFDRWVDVTRARTIGQVQRALATHFARPSTPIAAEAAELSLDLEPHDEAATRCLMQHHWLNGSAARAVEVYNRLYRHLDETFDQEPETETVELLAAIKLDPDGAASLRRRVKERVLLCVRGADVSGAGAHVESFQSVLVSDLRRRLQSFREWDVHGDPDDPGEALTITLHLTPHLPRYSLAVAIHAPSGREPLWSGSIEDPHTGWLDKVRVLIVQVANALRVVVADRHTRDMAAELYDRWLQALTLKGSWSRADEDRAVEVLREITRAVPEFGPAHAELAGIYNIRHILRPGTYQSDELAATALSHALEAIAVDPMDTRAHRVLAWCYCHKGDFDLAEFHFDQSLLLNPQNMHTLASAALGFAFTHDPVRCREQIDALARLPRTTAPFHAVYLAASRYLMGDYQAAAEDCGEGAGLMSTVGGWHSAALAKLGRTEEARARLCAFCDDIAADWYGAEPATPAAVIDWFAACFPLRHERVRDDLRQTLGALLPAGDWRTRSVAHVGDVDSHRSVEG